MSSLMRPVGPEENQTYWRRRAAAGGVLLVVLLLVWLAFSALTGGGSAGEPSAAPTFGLDESVTPAPSISTGPSASPAPAGSPAATPAATPAGSSPAAATTSGSPVAACRDADLVVTVRTSTAATRAGEGLDLTMAITNNGRVPCSRDVGPAANEIWIASGTVQVWSSDYCNAATGSDVQTLTPGVAVTSSATWPGKVTPPDCPGNQTVALPGYYRVGARNAQVLAEQARFTVVS